MNKTLSLLIFGVALLAAGCSSTPVKLDYDPEIDFTRYKTFDWLDDRPGVPEGVKAAMSQYPVVDGRVRGAVSGELIAKGLAEDQVDPDVLVAYHVGDEDKIDVTRWGYRYSDPNAVWGRGIDVYPYRKGTLILDVIDAETMHLVWRASAGRAIEGNPAQADAGERIGQAVEKMFQAFPVR